MVLTLLLVGLTAFTALGVLVALEDDARFRHVEKAIDEARRTAEGGLKEVLNDARLLDYLPTVPGDSARFVYGRPTASLFGSDEALAADYQAEVTLVRTAPVFESSQRRVRALVYEVEVRGLSRSHRAGAHTEAVVYRIGVGAEELTAHEVFGR